MAVIPAGFSADNAGKPYSLTNPEPGVLRFEVRKGDQYASPDYVAGKKGYADPIGTERNEVKDNARYDASKPMTAAFTMTVEPGQPITSAWVVVGQVHSALNVTPPIEFCFQGSDRLKIISKSGASSRRVDRVQYHDPKPIERGREYWFVVAWRFGLDGWLDVWRDGDQIVDYEGPVGYTDQTKAYWRCGIYRKTAAETLAVRFKGLGIAPSAAAEPLPVPVEPDPVVVEPEPEAPAPPPAPVQDHLVNVVTAFIMWSKDLETRLKALETK